MHKTTITIPTSHALSGHDTYLNDTKPYTTRSVTSRRVTNPRELYATTTSFSGRLNVQYDHLFKY